MTEVFAQYALVWATAVTAGAACLAWVAARWVTPDVHVSVGGSQAPVERAAGVPVLGYSAHTLSGRARIVLIVLAAVGIGVFALIVLALAQPGPLDAFDHRLATGMAQSMNRLVLRGVALFTVMGDRTYLMGVASVVLAVLLWRKDWILAAVWVAASAGGGLLNATLKSLFERVRPDHAHGFVQTSGFSFPSGHATGAVAVYAMLAFVVLRFTPASRHPTILASATALIAAIGLSRVLLHVHFASDVLAGWAITGAWVALCVLALDALERRRAGIPSLVRP